MERLHVAVGLLFLGLFLLVQGQQDTISADAVQSENSTNDAMTLLQNITTIEAFVALLTKNGRQMTVSDIYSVYDSETGKMVIEGGGRLAEPDDCSPRLTTVRLNFSNADSKVVHFPRCTKIERCGGCCSSANLECVPAYAERVSLKVVKAEMQTPGSSHMTYTGFSTVIVDRHVTCRVQCSLNEQKCGPLKTFLQNQCSCRCKEYRRCQSPHIWDPENCQCKCAVEQNCCPQGGPCQLVLNPNTCECVVDGKSHILSNNNLTDEQMAQYRESQASANNSSYANSSEEETAAETTPAPTTTVPTTATTTAAGGCSTQTTTCPPHLVPTWNQREGRCTCRFRNRLPTMMRNP